MNNKHYLLLKTQNKSGLKYLCYHYGTEESCFKYKGSGSYWLNHLKKHGKDISTIILKESNEKNIISEEGIKYSKMWNIVDSKEFANLIIENAESDPTKIHTEKARKNRIKSYKLRISKHGLTAKEIQSRKNAIRIMHSPENRKKAIDSIRLRHETGNLTEKQINAGQKRKERILKHGFTEKELAFHKKISESQINISMRERLNDPNWVNPHKGKTGKEIYGDSYIHPRQGKKLRDVKGRLYIEPKSKPFKIVINNNEIKYFSCERDFIDQTKLTSPMLIKIKNNKTHVIKRQSNSLHSFNNGDILEFFPITINEYKEFLILVG